MKKVLNTLIDSSQTGFLKGRYIGENIRTIFEVIDNVNEDNLPGMIFFADFEKAFDSIDHNFIFKCLNYFNFGSSFINWVKLFYKAAQSCVINNGHMSDYFNIERGVRQGCPLSPYLFILVIEILYSAVRKDIDIKGITMYNREIKNTAFADDATFILDGSKKSFIKLIDKINEFSSVSGLKLNSNKSIMFRIGSLKDSNDTYGTKNKYIWTNETATTLGIVFANNRMKIHELNIEPKIKEFCNCLKRWKRHSLSLIGKITVIKTFALPKIIYPLTVLENPPIEYINLIKKSMLDFIWDGKPAKIKMKTLIQDYTKGGLKMIEIESFIKAIKAGWVKRLSDTDNIGDWKSIYLTELHNYGGVSFFKCNINSNDTKNMKFRSLFLSEIVTTWGQK